ARGIRRDSQHLVPGTLQRGQRIPEITGLGGAARGGRLRIEIDHDLLAAVVAQRHRAAISGSQREVRGRVAGLKTGRHRTGSFNDYAYTVTLSPRDLQSLDCDYGHSHRAHW